MQAPHGHVLAQQVDQFRNLFEAAAEGKLGAGRIFDEDAEIAGGKVERVGSLRNSLCRALQAFLAGCAAKGTGVEDEILGLERESALDFATEGGDGLGVELGVASGEIDEIVGVNDQRAQVVLLAQAKHRRHVFGLDVVRLPLARTRREYLQRVAAEPVGTLGGVVHASGGGGVDADAAGRQHRRLGRREASSLRMSFSWRADLSGIDSIVGRGTLVLRGLGAGGAISNRISAQRNTTIAAKQCDHANHGGPAVNRAAEGHCPGT